MKIQYHINDFIDHCIEKGLSRKTYLSYEKTLVLFANYLKEQCGIVNITDVNRETVREYIAYIKNRGKYTVTGDSRSRNFNYPDRRTDYGKKVSDVTINNYIRNIKVFFNYLEEYRYIKKNPISKIKQIKVARKPLHFIDDREFLTLINSMDLSKFHEYRDYIIINILMDTGMRIGECLKLKLSEMDFKDRSILLLAENTKGKRARYVFFSQKMGMEIKQWIQFKDRHLESELMFPSKRGSILQVNNFETNLRKYSRRLELGYDIHPHMFRNNFAKRFLVSGGDIYTLSRILGHSSVEVTEKEYLDLDTSDLRKQYMEHSPLANMKRY